ncbi:Serine/threonine-protein kinase [Ceratobasidium sp. AG-Ba]|nr:Serine/threonine-protein kinase [Ceratobasidium sp. AG-Ba]QRW08341.1 Serine/threonine-protein kinase [Ceratobasidium sp. AG-Ba]
MRQFWDCTKSERATAWAKHARKALSFIVSHGGATTRWRSVIIQVDCFASLRAVSEFLRTSPLPIIQFLELLLDCPSEVDGSDETAFHSGSFTKPVPLFKDTPHNLRTARLHGFPNPFLFGHSNQLHLPGLVRLDLQFVDSPPNLRDISSLLKVTSQLEVLRFDFGWVEPEITDASTPQPKIQLPRLREFALKFIKEGFWPLHLLMTLNAPNVEYFQLGLGECEVGDKELVQFIADGETSKPIFPEVTRLEVHLGTEPEATPLLKILLQAHPKVTVLELPWTTLGPLSGKPWLVPRMERLRVAGCRGSELRKVVMARTKAKLPLKIVEAGLVFSNLIKSADRKYLKKTVQFRFVDHGDLSDGEYNVVDDPPTDDEFSGLLSKYSQGSG